MINNIISDEVYSKDCDSNEGISKNSTLINIIIIVLLYLFILFLTVFIYKKYNKIILEYKSLKSKLRNKFKNKSKEIHGNNISSIDGISIDKNINNSDSDNDSDSDPDSIRPNKSVNNYIFDRPIKNF